MDPFTLWFLGGVVVPDAYERAVNGLRARSAEERLAKSIRGDIGRYPRRVFRRWYRAQETWEALVRGGPESFRALVDRLIEVSGDRLLGTEFSRDRAEAMVRAAVVGFMRSLDPSDAVDVADYRSAQRDRLIDENAERRTLDLRMHVDERFDSVESRLEGAADFEGRVASLPAPVRPFFEAVGATRRSLQLLDIGGADRPREALVQLTADIPPWLRDASAATLRTAAELCRAYRVHFGAGVLFELAADVSSDRGYLLARAAIEFQTAGDVDRSNELLQRAKSLSTSVSVSAIAAALADDPGTVLAVLSNEAALEDPFLVSLYLYGLRTPQAFAEVIPFLTLALERYPESPGLMIELAWSYLRRSQEVATTSRTADRDRALHLGLEARRLRREWRIDAAEATRVACQAALSLGAYDRAIRIGMEPPDGDALPGEAADLEVRLSVAQAAVASGNRDLLSTVVDLVPEGFHGAMIQAEVLLHTGADPAVLAEAYDKVWAQATEEQHRVLYWLSASAAGVALRGRSELDSRADDVSLLVDAQLHMTRGENDAAIRLLRQGGRTEHTSRLLVGALIGLGDIDGAIDELKTAADRFNDTAHLVRAVEVLRNSGRLDDAAAVAEVALQRVPRSLAEARAILHETLVERAGVAEEWGDMAVRSRAWIEDLGSSLRNRWHLALASYQGGDRPGAWRLLQEDPALEPTTASQARLWAVLAATEAPSPEVADQILALLDAFDDDKRLAETAVGLFFGRGDDVWGPVRPESVTRYQELLTAHAVDFGSDQDAAIYALTGTTEEMLERLRPSLEANSSAIEQMTEKVRQGWPYGLLASVGHRPYTAALVHRAAGCLPIAAVDDARSDVEIEIARSSFGRPVVVDVSTLVISGLIRRIWPTLRGSFARLELPRPAHHDILSAVEDFRTPSHGTLYFDASIQAVRGTESDPAVLERLLDHSEWVAAQLNEVVVVDWPHLVALGDDRDDTFLQWLSALDMAKARGLPLWCDDLGLRTLASNEGVQTFGTVALIAALVADGQLEPGMMKSAFRLLREEYAVDLPLDAEWVRLSAASEDWRPGPAALYFTRPAAWIGFNETYGLWSELAESAATIAPLRVAGWVHAAAYGVAHAVSAQNAASIIVAIAAKGIAGAQFDSETIAACAARVREVALAAGLPNPVPELMAVLLRHLSSAVGPEAAAQRLLSGDLADIDRVVARDLVFGLRSHPGPIDG